MTHWDMSTGGKLAFLILLIAGSVAAGYAARRMGLGERIARVLSWLVLTVPYTVVSFLAIWVLKFTVELSSLPVMGLIILASGVGISAAIARWLKMSRPVAGAFVLASGASNLGFTMGGFVNFALFGEQGLAVAAMYTIYWEVGMALVLYPVARHYGHAAGAPLWKLILANFRDPRCLPLLAAVIGLTLNLAGVSRPAVVDSRLIGSNTIIDLLIIGGAVLGFFTTGVRLHFEHILTHRWLYPIVGAVKFIFLPAVGAVLVGLMWLAGTPLVRPLEAPAWKVVLVQASTPTAIYAVVLSNLFNLDDKLASVIFVVNTAMYLLIVLPIIVMVFG